jgi:PT repeat
MKPSSQPTSKPTFAPTDKPTDRPSFQPTAKPTVDIEAYVLDLTTVAILFLFIVFIIWIALAPDYDTFSYPTTPVQRFWSDISLTLFQFADAIMQTFVYLFAMCCNRTRSSSYLSVSSLPSTVSVTQSPSPRSTHLRSVQFSYVNAQSEEGHGGDSHF